jgi:hypothetical protein
MFCSIEDAWGEKNFADKPLFKQSDKPEHFTTDDSSINYKQQLYNKYIELKEMFDKPNKTIKSNKNKSNIHEHFSDSNIHENFSDSNIHEYLTDSVNTLSDSSNLVCKALDKHLLKCKRCRHKYLRQDQINRFDFSNIIGSFNSNKDIITIFLLGLLVILLLQLFASK